MNIGSVGLLPCGFLSLCRILDPLSFESRVPTLHPILPCSSHRSCEYFVILSQQTMLSLLQTKPALVTPAQYALPLMVKSYSFLKVLSKFLLLWKHLPSLHCFSHCLLKMSTLPVSPSSPCSNPGSPILLWTCVSTQLLAPLPSHCGSAIQTIAGVPGRLAERNRIHTF